MAMRMAMVLLLFFWLYSILDEFFISGYESLAFEVRAAFNKTIQYILFNTYYSIHIAYHMPRKSDTHSRVIEVADQLLEEGVRPTQQNVRERLGSGSLTTINRALNDWWHTLAQRISRRNEHPELPEPVLTLANQ